MILLGGWVYILSVAQYFFAQAFAAAAWHPPYDWFDDYISDLGNTACSMFATPHGTPAWVCSPRHAVVNGAFVTSGVLLIAGTVALRRYWPTSVAARSATALLLICGCGKMLVGAAPENERIVLHSIAALNIPVCDMSVLLMSISSYRRHRALALIGFAAAVLGLVGTTLTVAAQLADTGFLLGLGAGGMERLAAYPGDAWIFSAGITVVVGTSRSRRHWAAARPGIRISASDVRAVMANMCAVAQTRRVLQIKLRRPSMRIQWRWPAVGASPTEAASCCRQKKATSEGTQ